MDKDIKGKNVNEEKVKGIIEQIRDKSSFSIVTIKEFAPPDAWAECIARYLGRDMKTTQLRKVFTQIKAMELKIKGQNEEEPFNDHDLYMLIPYLAYAKARDFIKDKFYDLIKIIIGDGERGKIRTVADFRRFSDFMTAVVAYHKQYSEKEG